MGLTSELVTTASFVWFLWMFISFAVGAEAMVLSDAGLIRKILGTFLFGGMCVLGVAGGVSVAYLWVALR